jgi:hypothetical protein
VSGVRWVLDKPVSNSGRLKALLLDVAAGAGCNWQVELVFNPDGLLAKTNEIIATSDAAILDRCSRWVNLVRLLIEGYVPQARAVDFSR